MKRGKWKTPFCRIILVLISVSILSSQSPERRWPREVETIYFFSSADSSKQASLFYNAGRNEPKPLLIALHSWSGDYRQSGGIPYAEWCLANNWNFLFPDFRGPCTNPSATGSEWSISDVFDALDYAIVSANVDADRIYLIGSSWGASMSLLVAARDPYKFAGISAWVPVYNLDEWYRESVKLGTKYAEEIAASCGGAPNLSAEVDEEYRMRSPVSYINRLKGIPIDLNTGIHDGHEGPVPVSHSLNLFNALADPADQFSTEEIAWISQNESLPVHLRMNIADSSYGLRETLLRRESANVRLTVFRGGHEIIYNAGLNWLGNQKR